MTKHFDYCILGAGLAGITLASELTKENASVCLIDPKGIASGASGTPLGLVNPATGRYATLTWEAEKCYTSILDNLTSIQQMCDLPFFKKTGVLRPALDEKIAKRMKENLDSMPWPNNWIEWFDEDAVKKFHPGMTCIGGGVWVSAGLTVDISSYLKEFVRFLISNLNFSFFESEYSIIKKDRKWEINLTNHETIRAEKLVFTTGASTNDFDFWKDLLLYPVKGQLAVLESQSPLLFDHAVSALGYIASMDSNRFIIGSTYEHSFNHEQIDEQGLDYLLIRFGKVLPELKASSKVISQWSGVRASTPNRMPILGSHPNEENLYIFAGLGSKGLLYSGYLSKKMKDYLMFSVALPSDVNINRFA